MISKKAPPSLGHSLTLDRGLHVPKCKDLTMAVDVIPGWARGN
jgi:hypothetical protein